VGLKAGLNIATESNNLEGSTSRKGLIAGAFLRRTIHREFGIQVEGLYSRRGDTFLRTTTTRDYLEVPALATFTRQTGHVRPTILIGPAIDFKLRTCYGTCGNDPFQKGFNEFVRTTQFGWIIGGGVNVSRDQNIVFEGRYTVGVTPIFDADPTDSDADKTMSCVFSIG